MPGVHILRTPALPAPPPKQEPAKEFRMRKLLIPVAQYLISKGMKQERIITIGGGENHPVAGNDTEAGRAQNRRVELTLLPLKQ
jgi:hypothetical protein